MTATLPAEAERLPLPERQQATPRSHRLLTAAVVVAVLLGAGLRLVYRGPLWLDEALTVDIARLPVHALLAALRRDGSPPLFYLMLHGWMALFGTSTLAVRALPGVLALAALPLGYVLGRRLFGREGGVTLLLLLAAGPYAIRYASETRMYSLEILLVLAGALVLPEAVRSPRWATLAPVTGVTTLLAYTHYWAFFLLAVVAAGLIRRRAWPAFGAMGAAGVLYLPWVPTLLFQLQHTGTPWAPPPTPGALVSTVLQWGGAGWGAVLLGAAFLLIAALGLFGRAVPGAASRVELDLRGRSPGRQLALLCFGPMILALLVSLVAGSGFVIRYTAVSYPAFLALLTAGVLALPSRRWRHPTVALLVIGGLVGGALSGLAGRSQAGEVATAIRANALPGDVVGYCPDQLGPAVSRLLTGRTVPRQLVFADPTGPALVDWVDYAQRMRAADPGAFAGQLLDTAGPHTVFLVEQDGYRTLGSDCGYIASLLAAVRGNPVVLVGSSGHYFAPENLLEFPAPARPGG